MSSDFGDREGVCSGSPSPFAEVGPKLHALGYSPIPIGPGTKAPGQWSANGEWRPMRHWQECCKKQPTAAMIRAWSSWPSCGVGVACGRGLVVIDVDCEEALDAIMNVLPGTHVAKTGRKGRSFFYKGDTSKIRSRNFRTPEGVGLLDLLAEGKQTVLPPSLHPATGEPYFWTTNFALDEVPLDELPELPDDVADIIAEALRPFGYEPQAGRKPKGGARPPETMHQPRDNAASAAPTGTDGPWHRVNVAALANLSAWVPYLGLSKLESHGPGFRAVAPWRASGSGRSLAARSPNLSFHPTGIRDFGSDEGFRPIKVVEHALNLPWRGACKWLCDRLGLDWSALVAEARAINGGAAEPIALVPTYPDRTVPREVGLEMLNQIGTDFVAEVRIWPAHLASHEAERATKNLLPPPKPPFVSAETETGSGKSRLIVNLVTENPALTMHVWGPRTDLNEQTAARLRERGGNALAYRGHDKPDPERPGDKMCLDPEAYRDAIAAGVSVHSAVCERKGLTPDGWKTFRCKRASECGMMRQRKHVGRFVLTYDLRYLPRPDFIPPPDANLGDERPDEKVVPNKPITLTVDQLMHEPDSFAPARRRRNDSADEIELPPPSATSAPILKRVADVLRNLSPSGGAHSVAVPRSALLAAGLTTDDLWRARNNEIGRLVDRGILPGMAADQRKRITSRLGPHNALIRKRVALLDEMADFLVSLELRELDGADVDEGVQSGRIEVRYDAEKGANVVEVWQPLRPHPSWEAPTLALSATMPAPSVLELAEARPVEMKGSVAIQWPEHVHVKQYLDAEMGAGKTGRLAARKPGGGKRKRRALARFIALRAAMVWPRTLGVICRKELVDLLRVELSSAAEGSGQPLGNIDFMHFGALTGMNDWEDAAGLIVIDTWQPERKVFERAAGVLSGIRPNVIPADEHSGFWYPKREGGIRLRDGRAHRVEHVYHPDPLVEELRRVACEGELIQALGRLRAIWRTADRRCFVDIVNNVPLPVTVDEVVPWDDAEPEWSIRVEMTAAGILRTNAPRWQVSRPDLTDRRAKDATSAVRALIGSEKSGPFFYKESSIEKTSRLPIPLTLRFKHGGQGGDVEDVVVLPNGPRTATDIRAALGVPPDTVLAKIRGPDAGARAVFAAVGRNATAAARPLARLASLPRPMARAIGLPGVGCGSAAGSSAGS